MIGACICSNDVNVCGSAHCGCVVDGSVAMAAFLVLLQNISETIFNYDNENELYIVEGIVSGIVVHIKYIKALLRTVKAWHRKLSQISIYSVTAHVK